MDDQELERILRKKVSKIMERIKKEEVSVKEPIELSYENFDEVINKNKLVIVDFWAEWCGPCLMMHPIFVRLARKYGDKIIFGRLNVDEYGDIAAKYRVFSIPTFIIFKNGVPVDSLVGAVGEKGLELFILKHATD
jgi:thioredoxin 1